MLFIFLSGVGGGGAFTLGRVEFAENVEVAFLFRFEIAVFSDWFSSSRLVICFVGKRVRKKISVDFIQK